MARTGGLACTEASNLVERSPDGTVKTVAKIAGNVFPGRATYHANSVSLAGEMREVSPAGDVVEIIQLVSRWGNRAQVGYADFRPTLYGPPLR